MDSSSFVNDFANKVSDQLNEVDRLKQQIAELKQINRLYQSQFNIEYMYMSCEVCGYYSRLWNAFVEKDMMLFSCLTKAICIDCFNTDIKGYSTLDMVSRKHLLHLIDKHRPRINDVIV